MDLPIQTLIVDDTALYRKILSDAASSFPNVEIAGTASSGLQALKKIQTNPNIDLILMDVYMPEMDGLQTLKEIKKINPFINVVILSSAVQEQAELTIKALQSGAIEFIPKPQTSSPSESIQTITKQLQRIIPLVNIKKYRNSLTRPTTISTPPPPPHLPKLIPPKDFEFILIGCSTGGPSALDQLIPKLSQNINCPIFLVQHIPPNFSAALAKQLQSKSPLSIIEASDNTIAQKNTVYIAPGGSHMEIARSPLNPQEILIRLNQGPLVNSCRPSVDVLFNSAIKCIQSSVLTIILTGMGEDGAQGIANIKQAFPSKCYTLTEDESSCVVYGMPKAVVERGLSNESLHLSKIADRINSLFFAPYHV